MSKWGRTLANVSTLLGILIFIACINSVDAIAQQIETESMIVDRSGLGVGAGPQAALSIIAACRASEIKPASIQLALANSLQRMGFSPDPPTADLDVVFSLNNEWKTQPNSLSTEELTSYNSSVSSNARLSTQYRYFLKMSGLMKYEEGILRLRTISALEYGASFSARRGYPGEFDARFFHNELLKNAKEFIGSESCK